MSRTDPAPPPPTVPASETLEDVLRGMWLAGYSACWRELFGTDEDPPAELYNAAFDRWLAGNRTP